MAHNAGPNAITDLEQLKTHPALEMLLAWNPGAVRGAKYDRNELTIEIDRALIRESCSVLKPRFSFMADVTCSDWAPTEPRFHVVYHLLSHELKERVRLKVMVEGDNPVCESVYPLWPSVDFFEREIFDLFGIRFIGHPNMRRIMMPEDWEGHPLRKDYPVEGYR
jgi:NADH-quinone oxidoreductase subunit C